MESWTLIRVEDFQHKLQRLIDHLGYGQREIADICAVSQQSVSRWKSGASSPPVDRIAELMPVFVRLESEALSRLDSSETSANLLSAFLHGRSLEGFMDLLPARSDQLSWNRHYGALVDQLESRVPLLRVELPLGHGISSVARATEARLRERLTDVICIRLGIELLTATVSNESERDAYRRLLLGAYGPASESGEARPDSSAAGVASLSQLADAIGEVIRVRASDELWCDTWSRVLGSARYGQVLAILENPDASWRDAIHAAGPSVQIIVILDLSPSPAGRTYTRFNDSLIAAHSERVDKIVSTAAAEMAGLPRVSFFVLSPIGVGLDLTALENSGRTSTWEVLDTPPRLERTDFLDILSRHAGRSRVDLDSVIQPRLVVDLATRGISSANFELTHRLTRALEAETDNAGVIHAKDISVADGIMQSRLYKMERRVNALAEAQQLLAERQQEMAERQQEILDIISRIRGTAAAV